MSLEIVLQFSGVSTAQIKTSSGEKRMIFCGGDLLDHKTTFRDDRETAIERNRFAVALRNFSRSRRKSFFSHDYVASRSRIAVTETYFASGKTNLRTSTSTLHKLNCVSKCAAVSSARVSINL